MYIYTYIIYTYIRLHYYSLSMYIYIKQELTSCPSGVQRAADGLLAGGQQRSGTQFLLYQYNSTSTDAEGPATDVGKCSGTGPRSMTAHVNEQIAALEEDPEKAGTTAAESTAVASQSVELAAEGVRGHEVVRKAGAVAGG